MSQSQVMIGALIAGFILWLLMNNGLAKYWALLTGGGATTPATPTTTPGSSSTTPSTTGASPGTSTGGITINPGPTSAGSPSFFSPGATGQ